MEEKKRYLKGRPGVTHGKLYGRRWQKARARYLQRNPLCAMCQRDGRITEAVVVDHIVKHDGDERLFWDESNWQSLCKAHHDITKQKEEATGHQIGCDANGFPYSRDHW